MKRTLFTLITLALLAPSAAFAAPTTANPTTAQATPQTATDCLTTGCPDGYICKGSPATCQVNPASCTPACGGTTPICNQNADGTFSCISQAQYGNQTPGGATAQTLDNSATVPFVPLAPIPGLTANQSGTPFSTLPALPSFLNNLYKYAIGLAAAIAVVYIIWGGIEMSVQESVSQKLEGKNRIYNALFGLGLMLLPALVFGIINPSILNLSLNIPNLPTQWGTWSPTLVSKTTINTVGGGAATIASDQYICPNGNCQAAIATCNNSASLLYHPTPIIYCVPTSNPIVTTSSVPLTPTPTDPTKVSCPNNQEAMVACTSSTPNLGN